MSDANPSSTRWTAFRVAMALSGVWFIGYAVYRYTLFNPPQHGTVYGVVFPAALLLAVTGLILAARPGILGRRKDAGTTAFKGALSGFALIWMATGVHCTTALVKGVASAPLGGAVDMIHMVSDHVFLSASIVALAWVPEKVAHALGGRLDGVAPAASRDLAESASGA